MANIQRNFVAGKMNKSLDERVLPNGQYVDALNVRLGSTEQSEVGAVENTKGNEQITTLRFEGSPLSSSAKCIGALEDGANETIYWFVHDPLNTVSSTGIVDMVVSYNVKTNVLTYHLVSINSGDGTTSTLNFNDIYLITGVNFIDGYLYWTDNYNPPRFINVNRAYDAPASASANDGFSAESILVIKKPPINSPSINSLVTFSQDNFLEENLICFAYRYRYEDGEYSAISQFSNPSFVPGSFKFNQDSMLNEGMVNVTNSCEITYNSGGSLVKGIDLLFKESNGLNVKVIEKLDKSELGLADDTEYTYIFNNNKIFTVLPSSEILRLYDNVPKLAQAQTFMGNRLVYGNYVDGYDLVDANGYEVKLEYTTDLISSEIGFENIEYSLSDGLYGIDGPVTVTNAVASVDLTDVELKQGGILTVQLRFEHFSPFTGDTPFPSTTTGNTEITFTYILPQDFNSAYELSVSDDFIEKIGTTTNIQTVANSCVGTTLTDLFNCAISDLSPLFKFASGIDADGQPIRIVSSPTSSEIGFQLPAMRFVNNVVTPTQDVYEYYEIKYVISEYTASGTPSSLHSNRDYEVGIVYMDEFNRSTTALVSETNAVHVPCGNSSLKNEIRITIPPTQVAPSWATRYKFVIKQDRDLYETIYSDVYFRDVTTASTWFRLEGENAAKVETGDRYIVKADSTGVVNRCSFATVLDKVAQEREFLDPAPVDSSGDPIKVPQGVYMRMKPNDFSAIIEDDAYITSGTITDVSKSRGTSPVVYYPVRLEDSGGTFQDYTIPAGSRITIYVKNRRVGVGRACEGRNYTLDLNLISSQDYPDFKSWWDGDNIEALINSGEQLVAYDGCDFDNTYYPTVATNPTQLTQSLCSLNFQFLDFGSNNERYLTVSGTFACGKKRKRISTLDVNIEVIRTENLMIFETEPQDALPDAWYESAVSYSIDDSGNHTGNVQNQNISTSTPAIIDTEFFNCYAFGNGVESFKIRDSIIGEQLKLGNRVTTTSAQDFKEIKRFADLTYSGVYNDETNVNKLNEFNLGLANFKPLEDSYGPIFKIDGRQTDILVLQEDKISYVLAGKNLLSDSTGGGNVASIPEVLGTQIARMEDYGISHNPESFAKLGFNKYFTDAKRGAVIQLTGSGYQSEQLSAVSKSGMNSWFRDLFIESFSSQKLGGYDPYMDEYVLSSNQTVVPVSDDCLACGIDRTISVSLTEPVSFCVDATEFVGDVDIVYDFPEITGDVVITATYNGTPVTTGLVSTGGTLTVVKDTVSVTEITVSITATDSALIELNAGCPVGDIITIIQVALTSNVDSGQQIHNEYRWNDGPFVSPLHSNQVTFASSTSSPVVSQYQTVTGPQGAGIIPADGATVSVISNKFGTDNYVFNILNDKFRYLRSNTLYSNNNTDIQALLAASINITPISNVGTGSVEYFGDFTMPSTGQYLYLIWDYRNSQSYSLCYNASSYLTACCDCEPTSGGVLGVIMQFSPVCLSGTWDPSNGGTVRYSATLDNLTPGYTYTSSLGINSSNPVVQASLSDVSVNQTFVASATTEVVEFQITWQQNNTSAQITPLITLSGIEGTAQGDRTYTAAEVSSIAPNLSSCPV